MEDDFSNSSSSPSSSEEIVSSSTNGNGNISVMVQDGLNGGSNIGDSVRSNCCEDLDSVLKRCPGGSLEMQRETLNSLVMPSCGDFDNMQSELNNVGSLNLVGSVQGSSLGVTVTDSNGDACGLNIENDDVASNNIIHINGLVGNYCQDSGAGLEIQKAIASLGGCLTSNDIGQLAVGNFAVGGTDYLTSGGIDLQSALANLGYTLTDCGNGIEIHTTFDLGSSDLQNVLNGLNCNNIAETLITNPLEVQQAINCYGQLSTNDANLGMEMKNASNCYTVQQPVFNQTAANSNNMEIHIGGMTLQQLELQKAINNSLGLNVVQANNNSLISTNSNNVFNNINNTNSIPGITNFTIQTGGSQQNLSAVPQSLNAMGIQTYVLSNIGNQLCISNLGVQNCPTQTLRQNSSGVSVKQELGSNSMQICNGNVLQSNNLIGSGNQIINNNVVFQNGINNLVQTGGTLSNFNLQNCLNTNLQPATNMNNGVSFPSNYVVPKVELASLDGINLGNLGQFGNFIIKNENGTLQNILNSGNGTTGFVNIPHELLLGLTGSTLSQQVLQQSSDSFNLHQLQQAAAIQNGQDSSDMNFLQQNQTSEAANSTPATSAPMTITTSGGSTCSVGPNGEKVFTCQHCGRQFNQSVSLNAHMRIHVGAKPFTCQQCQKQFSKFGNLKIHMRIHSGQKSLKCSQCQKSFMQNTNAKVQSSDRSPICPQCEKQSTNTAGQLDFLVQNLDTSDRGQVKDTVTENTIPNSTSYLSNATIASINNFITSMANQSTNSVANNTLNTNNSFATALSHNHSDNIISPATISGILTANKPYVCPECNQQFTQNCNLIDHMKVHTVQKAFSCPQCSKQFTRNSSLTHHMRNHSGEKPFRCGHCGKQFTRNSSLTHHMKVHSDGKLFTCSHCGKQFARHISLNAHMRVHASHRPFHCLFCPKQFTRNSSLNHHLRSHSGDKPYECPECQKQFTQNSSLKDHLRLHTGERPFNCNHCNKQFSRNSSLVHHLKIHTGDKPYTCQHCGKKFAKNIGLNAHMRIHTAARPFSCPHCNKQFTQNSNLNVHMRIHNLAHSNPSNSAANAASVVTAAAAALASSLAASSQQNDQHEQNMSNSTLLKNGLAASLPTTAQIIAANLPSAKSLLAAAAVAQQRRQDSTCTSVSLPQLTINNNNDFTNAITDSSNVHVTNSIQVPNMQQVFASLSGNSLESSVGQMANQSSDHANSIQSQFLTQAQKTALINSIKLSIQNINDLNLANLTQSNNINNFFEGVNGTSLEGLDNNLIFVNDDNIKNSIFSTNMNDSSGQSFINLNNLILDHNALLNYTSSSDGSMMTSKNDSSSDMTTSQNHDMSVLNNILYSTTTDSTMNDSMDTSENDNLLACEDGMNSSQLMVAQETSSPNTPLTVMTDSQLINLGASNNFQNLVF